MYAHITEISGQLVAEYKDMKLWLSDVGLTYDFCFGESVDLDYDPCDIWELADQLQLAADYK